MQHFSAKAICQHGVSNLSDLIMASIVYEIGDGNDDKHLDIVIKLLPHDPFGRYFVTINQFDLREIQFYTKVCDYYSFNLWKYCRFCRFFYSILNETELNISDFFKSSPVRLQFHAAATFTKKCFFL